VVPGAVFGAGHFLQRMVVMLSEWHGDAYVHYRCGRDWECTGGCAMSSFLAWAAKRGFLPDD